MLRRGTPSLMAMAETAIKAATEPTPMTVETFDNHIYFYSDVNPDRCLAAMRAIREADSRLRSERLTREVPSNVGATPIWLHINSGGDLFAGFAFADMLAGIATPVYAIAEGLCASAATLPFLACRKRFALPNSMFLIHQFSSWMWGNYEEFKDEMVLQDELIKQMRDFYTSKTKLDAETVEAMLKRNTWFGVGKAQEYGVIDGVYSR